MDIARLGLVIDPTEAEEGARRGKKAAQEVGQAFKDAEKAMSDAAGNGGKKVKKLGDDTEEAGDKAKKAATDFGRAGNAFTSAVNRATGGIAILRGAASGDAFAIGAVFTALVSKVASLGTVFAKVLTDGNKLTTIGTAAKQAAAGVAILATVLGGLLLIIGPIVAGIAALKTGFGLLGDSIDRAAEIETFTTQWAHVLGSFDAAEKKMESLARFANSTPFNLPGVTKAALLIGDLGEKTLEGEEGLRRIGDAAAKAQQPIDEMAGLIQRLYGNIKAGVGGGDELRRLVDFKIITPDEKLAIGGLAEDANNFAQAWGMVVKAMDRSQGSMKMLSLTWKGVVSTMEDAWDTMLAALGKPIIAGLKPLLGDVTSVIDSITAQIRQWEPQIQRMAASITAVVRTAAQDGGLEISLKAAADAFGVYLRRGIAIGAEVMKPYFGPVLTFIKDMLVEAAKAFGAALVAAIKMAAADASTGILATVMGKGEGYEKFKRDNADLAAVPTGQWVSPSAEDAAKGTKPFWLPSSTWTRDTPTDNSVAAPSNLPETDVTVKVDNMLLPPMRNAEQSSKWADIISKVEKDIPDTDAMKEWQTRYGSEVDKVLAESAQSTDDSLIPKKAEGEAFKYQAAEKAKKSKSGGGKSELQMEADRVLKDIATPDETFQKTMGQLEKMRDAGLLTEQQYQRALTKATADHAEAVANFAEQTKKAATANMSELQRMMAAWGDLKTQVDRASVDISQSIAQNMTQALTSWIDGSKSASEAFGDMAKAIINDILQIILKLMIQYAIQSALGMVVGTPTVGAVVKHEGGDASTGPRRGIGASTFTGAARLHNGGMVGLKEGEVPAILEKGEQVLTREQARQQKKDLTGEGNASKTQNLQILNVTDPRSIGEYISANPDIIVNTIGRRAPEIRRALKLNQ